MGHFESRLHAPRMAPLPDAAGFPTRRWFLLGLCGIAVGALAVSLSIDQALDGHGALPPGANPPAQDGSMALLRLIPLIAGAMTLSLAVVLLRVLARMRAATREIVEERTAALHRLALHDPVTQLPNRTALLETAARALTAARATDTKVAMLFIDLDGFKQVNDTLGHAAGDDLLREVGRRLRGTTGATDTVARIGGDEFVVLLEGWTAPATPDAVAERLLAAVRTTGKVTASIGIASGENVSVAELMRDADAAMYQAKERGKDTYESLRPARSTALECRA
jgi:diguanylate cyclase (GGDEF)-like protein